MEVLETSIKVILAIMAIAVGMGLHQWVWEKKEEYMRGYKYKKLKKIRRPK